MGIQGLLPLLKSIMNPVHIKELEGCSVAIDTYSWLHKGALSCSTDLCKGLPTSKHIDYCMHRVNMLRHYGVKPILVFDGGPLPMKGDQEIKRARSRRENLSRAKEHELNGNMSAAYECYQKAVDISPSIAYDLIQVLKQQNVPYIVAPYEADAQMTFLAINKHVEAVITEDSDLIAFGCPRIIYKMDKFGQGVEFKRSMIQHNKELNLAGFTPIMLLEMCILSGCDYLQSLPGLGLKKAHALIKKYKGYEKVIKHLKYSSIEVPSLYEDSFKRAILTFRHQRVYDPVKDDIVHLSEPVDVVGEDLDFLGPLLPQPIAQGISRGDLDPFTKLPIQGEFESTEKALHGTYQLKNFKPDVERRKIDLPAQKNLLTNYFCFATLEAKKQFKAPRATPYYPNENDGTSSSHRVHEANYNNTTDGLNFLKAQDHGPYGDSRITDCDEVRPSTTLQSPVCKPCTSSDKELDSGRENEKSRSGNKNVIVRSTYFLKKSRDKNHKENKCDLDSKGDNKFENVVPNHVNKPPSVFLEGKCRNEERKVIVRSSYFQQKSKQNDKSEREKAPVEYDFEEHRSGSGDGDCEMPVDNQKDRMRSSYFQEISVNETNEDSESELGARSGDDTETRKSSIRESPSGANSLECAVKKRKIAQTDLLEEDANDINSRSGIYSSDLEEEEAKTEEGKFGCNITHLPKYSNIAERSMENFVSVISSFRYNSSGSRASGLRPPLKDIKNNCTKSSMPCVDLNKFVYAPTKKKTVPGPKMS